MSAINLMDNATIVENYDGPVYCDGIGDDYFRDVDELKDCLDQDADAPEFGFCCKATPIAVSFDRIMEWLLEDAFDGAEDALKGVDELRSAVAAFNALNAGVCNWEADFSRKVRIK
jgi:hypothetical protein